MRSPRLGAATGAHSIGANVTVASEGQQPGLPVRSLPHGRGSEHVFSGGHASARVWQPPLARGPCQVVVPGSRTEAPGLSFATCEVGILPVTVSQVCSLD